MNDEIIHVCTDVVLSGEAEIEAEVKAIEEDIRNAGIDLSGGGPGALPGGEIEMALESRKLWSNGRTLLVHFLSGDEFQRNTVMNIAVEWCQYANLKFEFGAGQEPAQIRIGFNPQAGSWSAVGTDCLVVSAFPPGVPTMNFGWITPGQRDEIYRQVVLHEFGHALGCIHEHQHPEAGIPWNQAAVYAYYAATNGWNRDKVDANIFRRYEKRITQYSAYDPQSIMSYYIPPQLTQGGYVSPWNSELSLTDRNFISSIYPGSGSGD